MTTSADSESIDRALVTQPTAAWLRYLTITSIVLAYGPFFFLHGHHLWERRHYQFFPIFIAGVVALVWSRYRDANWTLQFTAGRSIAAALALIGGIAMLISAVVLWSPWLAVISALIVLGSGLLVADETARRDLVPIWFVLWLLVPPPFALDTLLIQRMQRWVSRVASEQLDLYGINHLPLGNILAFPDRQLLVDDACSGIQSLFALIACTALYALWKRLGILTFAVLVLSAAFWTFVANVARIVCIAVVYDSASIDLSKGWPHELLGFLIFALALGMQISTAVFVQMFLTPFRVPVFEQNVAMRIWNWLVGRPRVPTRQGLVPAGVTGSVQFQTDRGRFRYALISVMTVCFLVGALQMRIAVRQLTASEQEVAPAKPVELSQAVDKSTLPDQNGDWRLVEYRTRERDQHSESPFSNIWTYQSPYAIALFAFDYPYNVPHYLAQCYENIGWRIASERVEGSLTRQNSTSRWPYQIVDCEKPQGQHGLLLFSAFSPAGEALDPPLALERASLGKRLANRLMMPASLSPQSPVVYQVQLFVFSEYALSPAERQRAAEHFEQLRRLILDRHIHADSGVNAKNE